MNRRKWEKSFSNFFFLFFCDTCRRPLGGQGDKIDCLLVYSEHFQWLSGGFFVKGGTKGQKVGNEKFSFSPKNDFAWFSRAGARIPCPQRFQWFKNLAPKRQKMAQNQFSHKICSKTAKNRFYVIFKGCGVEFSTHRISCGLKIQNPSPWKWRKWIFFSFPIFYRLWHPHFPSKWTPRDSSFTFSFTIKSL